jgi:hypothetical protein
MTARQFLSTFGLASIGWRIILLTGAISLLLGLLAALVGGRLTALGNGIGGGNGIPDLVFLLAVLMGLPGLFRGLVGVVRREKHQAKWLLVFIGPLLISSGYILIAHALDPCLNGLWDLSSRIGDTIPLCERFGSEINIHTRFHYLWHVLPALPLIWLYGNALKRWFPKIVGSPGFTWKESNRKVNNG